MQRSYWIAAAMAFTFVLQTPLAHAQSTDTSATPPAVAPQPPATTPPPQATAPAPPAAAAPSAAAAAPAAQTSTPPAASATTTSTPATTSRKSTENKPAKKKQMTRQQEIDHSIDSGTVPARYRSSVPKEYQKYIPFDKQ